ncbi:MAG: hypothetical protein K2I63_04265, partial [Helicobacter sp.]|nr:hypothetical protein [Helicobacter sp.]
KYSSLSMSVNQASLMIGPIFAAFLFKDTPKEVIFWCGILFILSGLWIRVKSQAEIIHKATQEQTTQTSLKLNIIFGCLVLIWPTLALFNFMLPAQIAYSKGEMTEVGILDAAMGLGMILSSFLLSFKNAKKFFIHYYLSVGVIILGIICWFFAQNIFLKILSLLCLGISFNLIRISIRSFLAQEYDSQNVGKIVSYANSLSFFVIILLLSLFYDALSINWLLPFVLTLLLCIMFSMVIKNKQQM